jgi:iron complex transport system permease protein
MSISWASRCTGRWPRPSGASDACGIRTSYKRCVSRKSAFLLASLALALLFAVTGLTLGASSEIAIRDVLAAATGTGEPWKSRIIWHIRLPRVLAALLAGAGLSVSGSAMQSILRNPLGSPFTLGISQAAAFGAAFAVIVLGVGSASAGTEAMRHAVNPYLITVSAFAGSMLSAAGILLLAKLRDATPETMVLAGIALGSLFNAGITFVEYFASDVELASVVFWTFGDIGKAGWHDIWLLVAVVLPVCLYFVRNAWSYNCLDSGDETAKSLGVNVERLRILGMILASLVAAVVVSFFGIIGFVGLVVPHIVRKIVGSDEMFLIPASAVFGAAFLLAADTAARTAVSPLVLPVGILTSFLGAPLFLLLLIKGRRSWRM